MNIIKYYQDLLEVGEDERQRMNFVLSAIHEYKSSDGYRLAQDARMYYTGENPTINRYEKIGAAAVTVIALLAVILFAAGAVKL